MSDGCPFWELFPRLIVSAEQTPHGCHISSLTFVALSSHTAEGKNGSHRCWLAFPIDETLIDRSLKHELTRQIKPISRRLPISTTTEMRPCGGELNE